MVRKTQLRGELPRYVVARHLANGKLQYRFNPPQSLVDAGVVSRSELGTDLRKVRFIAKELNDKIDAYRAELDEIPKIYKTSPFKKLVDAYYKSNDFLMLKERSQSDYKYFIDIAMKDLGNIPLERITNRRASHLYEQWVKRGIQLANHVATVVSKVFNYAIAMDYIVSNPFAGIKRKKPKQRKTVWTKQDIIQFLDVAYSDYKTRSIGLIVQMAYEWCQRIGDMRVLKWDNLDLDNQRLTLEQSKRRALVHLPISDDLTEMLRQQFDELGFQDYVAPRPVPSDGMFHPYSMLYLSTCFRSCARLAGISDELRMADIRRTGTTEMVEAGVPISNIMQVTGHQSMQSVMPYMKHTLKGAEVALDMRKQKDK